MLSLLIGLSVLFALINGFIGQRKGYSFLRQFITGLIASAGILTLIYNLIKDYF